jgi:hypothetical protein
LDTRQSRTRAQFRSRSHGLNRCHPTSTGGSNRLTSWLPGTSKCSTNNSTRNNPKK